MAQCVAVSARSKKRCGNAAEPGFLTCEHVSHRAQEAQLRAPAPPALDVDAYMRDDTPPPPASPAGHTPATPPPPLAEPAVPRGFSPPPSFFGDLPEHGGPATELAAEPPSSPPPPEEDDALILERFGEELPEWPEAPPPEPAAAPSSAPLGGPTTWTPKDVEPWIRMLHDPIFEAFGKAKIRPSEAENGGKALAPLANHLLSKVDPNNPYGLATAWIVMVWGSRFGPDLAARAMGRRAAALPAGPELVTETMPDASPPPPPRGFAAKMAGH